MPKLPSDKREESLALGGQALIEGVMIRSRRHLVLCVRQPNDEILTHTEEIRSVSDKYKTLKLPFLRGIVGLFEMMVLGFKGLYFSANMALEEDEEFTNRELVIIVALVLLMTSFFIVVPFLITNFLNLTGVLFNIVEALIRLTFFLLYITLIALWRDFRRVLQYHGAEHKAINAFEAGASLDVASVKKFSRLNPRCGTSFIVFVMAVSVLLFSVIPRRVLLWRILWRLLLFPVIGSISYELLKASDRHRDSPIMKIMMMPGLVFQRLTTREPDDGMVEVAVTAVKKASTVDGT